MKYLPNSPDTQAAMLQEIGVADVEELFADIPESIRLAEPLDIAVPMSEFSLMREMKARSDSMPKDCISFLGGGSYRRFIPEAIKAIVSRAEFLTCYTPYQPELSQGSLQVMFEFQTLLSQLTGMDVANASMYEGATAAAESPQGSLLRSVASRICGNFANLYQTPKHRVGGGSGGRKRTDRSGAGGTDAGQ